MQSVEQMYYRNETKPGAPIPVQWATPPKELVGNALGYQTHIRYLKSYAEKGNHVIDDPESNIALHIVSADWFKPIPGKFNILFTMWEALDVPATYIAALNAADLVIVPCRWCKQLFQKVTTTPIEVCNHGTDIERFKFHDRTNQMVTHTVKPLFGKPQVSKRFRFLWVGAPNPRKGYKEVLSTLSLAERFPDIEIYLKTTAPKITWLTTVKSLGRNWKRIFDFTGASGKYWKTFWLNFLKIPTPFLHNRLKYMGTHSNVIFDTRMLSKDELVDLYKSANCFIFPTWGEGWGLTLSEALATGCPSIATRVTGVCDFFDGDIGYEIGYDVKRTELPSYNMSAKVYAPRPLELAKLMLYVIRNYPEALKKGKRASEKMRTKFTWENSAARLAEIIRRHACTSQFKKLKTT